MSAALTRTASLGLWLLTACVARTELFMYDEPAAEDSGDGTGSGDGAGCADNGACPQACVASTCAPFSSLGGPCDEPADCEASLTCSAGLCVAASTLVVEPVYPLFGAAWNDYVKRSAVGAADHEYNQPDIACAGNETGAFDLCIHGGEKRKAVLGGSSCDGLSIADSLEAFDWECMVVAGVATAYSFRLRDEVRLAALLEPTAWRQNFVTVRRGVDVVGESAPAVWWSNPVEAPPSNPLATDAAVNLDASFAGKVLVVPTSRATSGYNLDADRIAFVVLPGATLTYSGNDARNTRVFGGFITGAPLANDKYALLACFDQRFLWVEGAFDASAVPANSYADQSAPLTLDALAFSRLRHLTLAGTTTAHGLFAVEVGGTRFEHLRFESHSGAGTGASSGDAWYTSQGSFNRIVDVMIHATAALATPENSNALRLYDEHDNSYVRVRIANDNGFGESRGFHHSSVRDDTFVDFLVTGSDESGAYTYQSSSCTYSHFTLASNGQTGINLQDSPNMTLNQLVAVSNGGAGGYHGIGWNQGSTGTLAGQLVSAHNAAAASVRGLYGDAVALGATLQHNVLLGGNDVDCLALGSTNGFTSSCQNEGASTATWRSGVSLATSFVGAVTSDDGANGSDVAGARASTSINDWTHFDSPFRLWGRDGASFPDPALRGPCTTGTCRIWDWRLSSSDTVLRNTSLDGTSQNEPFVPGATCPTAVHGDFSVTDQRTTPRTFLANATEVVGDFVAGRTIGNDDGLCESGEACVYSPNFGAYQGEGDYVPAGGCLFVDGAVTGVTMYAYPINGR